MRIKTTFSLLCLVILLLSVGVLDIHANSCTSYYSTYLNKVEVHNLRREAYHRVQVAVAKKNPPFVAPPELVHLEDEYNSDPTGFYQTVQGMGVALPGYVSGPIEVEQSTTPPPPPPGETAESGHWHGDQWHAAPQEQPAIPPQFSESQFPAQTQDSKFLAGTTRKQRLRIFEEIRETLPKSASVSDIVKPLASCLLPKSCGHCVRKTWMHSYTMPMQKKKH